MTFFHIPRSRPDLRPEPEKDRHTGNCLRNRRVSEVRERSFYVHFLDGRSNTPLALLYDTSFSVWSGTLGKKNLPSQHPSPEQSVCSSVVLTHGRMRSVHGHSTLRRRTLLNPSRKVLPRDRRPYNPQFTHPTLSLRPPPRRLPDDPDLRRLVPSSDTDTSPQT